MYVQIHSVSEQDSDSRGATARIHETDFEVREPRQQKGAARSPNAVLELTAQGEYALTTGVRGGVERSVHRQLVIQFTEADLAKIVDEAMTHGFTFPEVLADLQSARKKILSAIHSLGGRPTRRSTGTRRNRRAD